MLPVVNVPGFDAGAATADWSAEGAMAAKPLAESEERIAALAIILEICFIALNVF